MKDIEKDMLKEFEKLIPDLSKKLNNVRDAMEAEKEAYDMAQKVWYDFEKLTFKKWNQSADIFHEIKNVEKSLGDHEEILELTKYGKAIGLVRFNMEHKFKQMNNQWAVKFKKRFSKDTRKRAERMEEAYVNGVTFMMVKAIKADILDKYELVPKKPKAKINE